MPAPLSSESDAPVTKSGLRQSPILRALVLALVLTALWLLLSGLFKPVVLALGFMSVLLVTAIVWRLDILDAEGVPLNIRFGRMITYAFWLLVEILKADWAVTKIILAPEMRLTQRLIRVPATTRTDLGKVVYANSITLTPGTVTVETDGDTFIVHALSDEAADLEALEQMNARVCGTEVLSFEAGGSRRFGPASSMG